MSGFDSTPPRRRASSARRHAAELLDQQLWCWGRDIARPEGNVLLDLGLCRHRSPGPGVDRSAYSGTTPGGDTVWLWGFGVMLCRPGGAGVFLKRYRFDPLLVRLPGQRAAFSPAELGCSRPASARERAEVATLVRSLAGWVASYEHWVAETLGGGYRAATLAARDRPPTVPARAVPGAWENLAKKSPRLAAQAIVRGGKRGLLLTHLRGRSPAAPRRPRFTPAPRPRHS